ncbi:MAG TPA: pyridoxal-phosphate dependent enzyme [Oleiagrimonas sp.]|nr:pyridoxal-phosphate dependent enzyme [Oleiagrimonas sp.]
MNYALPREQPLESPLVPLHVRTPLMRTELAGRAVRLKLENLQPARSFKIRGVGRLCQHEQAHGAHALVCSSAGNAGYAVAWAGRELGLPVTVVLPETSTPWMRDRIRALDANVVVHGEVWDDANQHALALAREPGVAYIPPFDHPVLWEGHASLVDELAGQCQRAPEAIVVAVGGGGLLLGVLQGLKRHGWHDTRVLAVEPQGAAGLAASLNRGEVIELSAPQSVATSLCVRQVSAALLPACREHPVTPVQVSDEACRQACVALAESVGMVVEPACGAALVPLLEDHPALAGLRDVVVVVCGGQVVTLDDLAAWSRQGT